MVEDGPSPIWSWGPQWEWRHFSENRGHEVVAYDGCSDVSPGPTLGRKEIFPQLLGPPPTGSPQLPAHFGVCLSGGELPCSRLCPRHGVLHHQHLEVGRYGGLNSLPQIGTPQKPHSLFIPPHSARPRCPRTGHDRSLSPLPRPRSLRAPSTVLPKSTL